MRNGSESDPVVNRVTDVAPDLLAGWLESGDVVLVDVREDYEHAEERVSGSVLHPLSKFDPDLLRSELGDRRVVFHCLTGVRSRDAASRYARADEPRFHLAGGLEAWRSSGYPVDRLIAGKRLPIMRQVQITAGALVAAGVGLGLLVSPWFLGIAGFVGCGLMFAGISGWCGMAKLLAAMPWNRAVGSGARVGARNPSGRHPAASAAAGS